MNKFGGHMMRKSPLLFVAVISLAVSIVISGFGGFDSNEPKDVSDVFFAQDGEMIEHTPSIIQASNGTYFIAYESGTAVWHFTINLTWSYDGINWEADTIIISTGGSYGNRHPTLIQRQDGDLQVVYLSDRSGDFELYTSISSDGMSWTEYGPLTVSGPAVNPFIIQEDNGNFAMSYQVYGSFLNLNDGCWFATSNDGINWATTGPRVSTRALPRLMRASGGGDYLMTYQGGNTGDFEIRYKTSSDGLSWGTEQTLTDTGNSHDSVPLQLVNGSYMVFFCTSLGGGGYDLYRKWSPDMSGWSTDEYLETNNFRFDTEPHPYQLSSNQTFILAWGYESSGAVGGYEDVDVALMWIEDVTSHYDIPITVTTGWQFISFPITATGDVLTIFDDDAWGSDTAGNDVKWDMIYWYDPTDVTDPWKSHNKNWVGTQDMPDPIDNTMGFWLHITDNPGSGDGMLTIGEGYDPSGETVWLQVGWNLVGYPSLVAGTAADLPGWGSTVTKIGYYDDLAPYDIVETSVGTTPMTHGNAYWVYSTITQPWNVAT